MRGRIVAIVIASTWLISAGCSDSGTEPETPVPATLGLVSGAGQSGTVGRPLPDSLVVKVIDKKGQPVSGAVVAWAARAGGGSLSATSVKTDASGLAAVTWTLGTAAGPAEASATVADLAPVTFTATGLHDRPSVVRLDRDSLAFDALGDTARLSATVTDQHGNAITTPALRWSSSDTAIARVDDTGLVTSRGTGAATIEVLADSARATAAVRIEPAVAGVRLEQDSVRLSALGDTAHLVAKVLDRLGNVVPDALITWHARDSTVARVDAAGVVTARSNGVSAIVATSRGQTDSVMVRVVQEVSAVTITAGRDLFEIGDTVRLVTEARDAGGTAVRSFSTAWTSARPDIATVDSSGLVLGVAAGRVTIRAAARATTPGAERVVTEEMELEVVAPSGVYITGITPARLRPGGTATIAGGGFGATAAENTVTIQGHPATVMSVTDGALTVTLPSSSIFGCQPTHAVEVAVMVADKSATWRHPLSVARQLPVLEQGEFVNLTAAADVACNELPRTGGSYLISIYNTSTAVGANAPFRLRGTEGESEVVLAAPGHTLEERPAGARPTAPRAAELRPGLLLDPFKAVARTPGWYGGVRLDGEPTEARRRALAHASVLEKNRELTARLGPPRRTANTVHAAPRTGGTGRQDLAMPIARAPQPLTPGTMLDLRVPDINSANFCSNFIPVRARVVYAGPKAIILEDSVAPLAGTMDTYYQAVGKEYEETMHPILEEYFGDPLAYDAEIGGAGRVLMLFSPTVNDFGGVAGFVTAADFYDQSICPASNEAQVFYAVVPTSTAAGYAAATADGWLRSIRSTVIHEVKHITSYAERFAAGAAVLEESWLEESTARISEELYGRKIFGNTHKGETDYRSSIYCEVRPTWPECGPQPVNMLKHFEGLYDYMNSTSTLSPLGRTSGSDASFYGSGWLLVRWAIDHYANAESTFLRALTREPNLSGVQNLAARTGKSFAELLGPWSLSLYWDRPTAPGLSHPSWDVYDIFAGLHEDFPESFPDSYPLYGWEASFGAFLGDVGRLNGGTAALFLIEGTQTGTQLLELQGYGGGALPPSLRMAIMRVKE